MDFLNVLSKAKKRENGRKVVEQCIREESERAKRYLDPQTEGKVLDVLENVLIKEHMYTIVSMENSGVHAMLGNDE
ncbi:hypothetical protein COOONC_16485, partial [Cooperia oncophora]